MRIYYFTIATPGRYMTLAQDLILTGQKLGIDIDIKIPEESGNAGAKSLKIEGILNAPSWADRIVFLDADTLLVDPTGLENYNGAILEPWGHKEGMYTIDSAPQEVKKRRLDCLYARLRERGLSNCIPPYEYGPAEWNSGVLSGERGFLEDLVKEWKIWWDIVLECNDGHFRRDQISFKYAYVAIHRKKYGFTEDLPKQYNWLVKRWGFSPEARILHKAGRPRAEVCKRWEQAKEEILNGRYNGIGPTERIIRPNPIKGETLIHIPKITNDSVWENPFGTCNCLKNCKHGGGIHSYIEYYQRVLQKIQPKKILEWGPGENTRIGLNSGAIVHSIEPKQQWIPQIESTSWTWKVIPVKEDAFIQFPDGDKDWDLFFVDSRRRQECISLAATQGKPGCVVCLHDAQRTRYHEHLKLFRFVKFLHKSFCIASNDPKILGV